MRYSPSIVLSLLMVVLVGCSSAPTYREASAKGFGYQDTRLADDRYRVSFRARGQRSQADNYALLRAAELTLLQGYDWFVVAQRETLRDRQSAGASASVGISQQTGHVHRDCGLLTCSTTVHSTGIGMDTAPTDTRALQETILHIHLGRGIRPETGEHYDATELRQTLRDQLELKG